MKIPVWILTVLLTGAVAVHGWTLYEVIALKVEVARIGARLAGANLAQR